MRHFFLFIFLLLNILVENYATPIIGGQTADENDFKYLVSIKSFGKRNNYGHICAGSVLSEYWIITAAHCFEDWIFNTPYYLNILNKKKIKKDMVLHIGSHKLQPKEENAYHIEDVQLHPKYYHFRRNDVALVKVKNGIKGNIEKIKLPKRELVSPGGTVTMAGWGYTTIYEAQPIWLQVLRSSDVLDIGRCGYPSTGLPVKPVICTHNRKGAGICYTDSGGPLVVREDETEYLVGIISHLIIQCASGRPVVHTNIFYHKDWIEKIILKT